MDDDDDDDDLRWQFACWGTIPPLLALFALYELHVTSWDGGLAPSAFVVWKTIWLVSLATLAMTVTDARRRSS